MADADAMLAAERSATSILHRELIDRLDAKHGRDVARIAEIHAPHYLEGRWVPECRICCGSDGCALTSPCATYQCLIDSVGF